MCLSTNVIKGHLIKQPVQLILQHMKTVCNHGLDNTKPKRKIQLSKSLKKKKKRAAQVAQRFSAAFSPGCDPGLEIESHVGLPAWSLLLPLPVSLPLSLCLS